MTPEVNRPDVVAEVSELFEEYERALAANDVAAMNERFWSDEAVVRYGVDEELYGATAVAEWRAGALPVPPTRTHGPAVVTTFGDAFAAVSTQFDNGDGSPCGRQSQTWVRLPEGWRIVAAHVSLPLGTRP